MAGLYIRKIPLNSLRLFTVFTKWSSHRGTGQWMLFEKPCCWLQKLCSLMRATCCYNSMKFETLFDDELRLNWLLTNNKWRPVTRPAEASWLMWTRGGNADQERLQEWGHHFDCGSLMWENGAQEHPILVINGIVELFASLLDPQVVKLNYVCVQEQK